MRMSSGQQFSLKWTNYTNHIVTAFDILRSKEDFCDVTLSCEGRKIRAHKVLLSACSSYFKEVFKDNPCQHPVIVFKNVKYDDLLSIVIYMYQGEVNVEQEALPSFLNTAEMLSIQGLTEDDSSPQKMHSPLAPPPLPLPPPQPTIPTTQQIATIPSTISIPATTMVHTQAKILKDTAPKFIINKQKQPIPIINTSAVDQIIYSTISQDTSPIQVQDVVPAKRKKQTITSQEAFTESNASSQSDTPMIEDDNDGPGYVKAEVDSEMTEAYNTDDEDHGEAYESTSQGEGDGAGDPLNDDFEKPKIATAAELGRLFTSGRISDTKRSSTGQPTATAVATVFDPNDVICQVCNKIFTSISAKKRHMQAKHTEIQSTVTCKICNNQFKTKWSLATHVSRFHRGDD